MMTITTITDVYLEPEFFNPVCSATIPGAWVAIVDGTKQAFGRELDFEDHEEAEQYALDHFNAYKDGKITQEQAHGICQHCWNFRTVFFAANENGEPVTVPICADCEEN